MECAARGFRYRSYNRHGRLRLKLTCSGLTDNARAGAQTLRRPYLRNFAIGNGTGTVRVDVDKPDGDAVPLVSLTTRPRDSDCTAKPQGVHVGGSRFRAEARVTCRGLPDDARGVLAVGGLLAPDHIDVRDPDQKPPPAGAATSTERFQKPCDDPETFTFEGASVTTQTCYKRSITLGPWETGWIGSPFSPMQAPCRSPWYAQSVPTSSTSPRSTPTPGRGGGPTRSGWSPTGVPGPTSTSSGATPATRARSAPGTKPRASAQTVSREISSVRNSSGRPGTIAELLR